MEKIGVNVSDDLTREQLLQLIKNASWEAKGIPVTRLKCLDDAQDRGDLDIRENTYL